MLILFQYVFWDINILVENLESIIRYCSYSKFMYNKVCRGGKLNKLKKQLLNLTIGEFAALCTFIFVYKSLNLGMASLIAFLYLIIILLQGSMYWFYRYILIIKRKTFSFKSVKFFRVLKQINIILIMIISIIIPIIKSSNKDLLCAIGLFLFGIIEYINYYCYRLSYGKSGFNIKILLNTKLQKSSINKLISEYY